MESAALGELPEFHLVAGHLARGTLVIQANGCPTDDTLTALTQSGPCLSVQWSDFAPPGVVYGTEGQIVVSFDDREAFAAPDWDSVERWGAAPRAERLCGTTTGLSRSSQPQTLFVKVPPTRSGCGQRIRVSGRLRSRLALPATLGICGVSGLCAGR